MTTRTAAQRRGGRSAGRHRDAATYRPHSRAARPHGLTFRAVADLYDLGYNWVKDWSEFHEALQKSVVSGGTNIIEIPGNRAANVDLHRMIWEGVAEKIHSSLDVWL